jgi:hypothetical protein
VDHARGVDGDEGLGQRRPERPQGAVRQCTVGRDVIGQRRPRHIGRRQPGLRSVDVGIEQGGDRRAADAPGGVDLAGEAGAGFGVVDPVGIQQLERDPAGGAAAGARRVLGQPHLPHPAPPEALDEDVRTHLPRRGHTPSLSHRVQVHPSSPSCGVLTWSAGTQPPGRPHPA